MTERTTQMAVLLRKAQWMLDDAAYNVQRGRLTSTEQEELAAALDELARTLKAEIPQIVDVDPATSPPSPET